MFRYVVVIWSETNPEQARAAQRIALRLQAAQWEEPCQQAGLRVFQTGVRPGSVKTQALHDSAGVVIGTVFERGTDVFNDSPARCWSAKPFETQAVLASRGRWLIDRCWGNYVAILRPPTTGRAWIIKDPTGSLPCFVTIANGVTVVFSLADDIVRLGIRRLTLNRDYLRALVVDAFDFRRSPLTQAEQVRRGEWVEMEVESAELRSRRFLWRPQPFAESAEPFDDPDVAARAMRASVRMSTHTWASLGSRIVHRLSGGLDSSIIAGCLRDAPNRPRVCCYTYFNNGAPSDERPWARLAAAHPNLEHREVGVDPRDIDLRRGLELPLQAEPTSILMHSLRSTIERQIAQDTGATMVFNGDGGDSGFGSEATRYAAAEYVQRRGLGTELLRIAGGVALFTHQSSWRVLYRAIAGSLSESASDPTVSDMPGISQLISRDALAGGKRLDLSSHPWFVEEEQSSWALPRRLGMLLASPEFYDGIACRDAPDVISPLCAQPVVEALLRIPLYLLFEGGRDRGLARRAFNGDVPPAVLARQWKDRAPGFHDQLVFINREFLREVFLEGVLLRDGLLDRAALENAFADRPSKNLVIAAEVIRHFDVEMWVRAWDSCVPQTQQRDRAFATY